MALAMAGAQAAGGAASGLFGVIGDVVQGEYNVKVANLNNASNERMNTAQIAGSERMHEGDLKLGYRGISSNEGMQEADFNFQKGMLEKRIQAYTGNGMPAYMAYQNGAGAANSTNAHQIPGITSYAGGGRYTFNPIGMNNNTGGFSSNYFGYGGYNPMGPNSRGKVSTRTMDTQTDASMGRMRTTGTQVAPRTRSMGVTAAPQTRNTSSMAQPSTRSYGTFSRPQTRDSGVQHGPSQPKIMFATRR